MDTSSGSRPSDRCVHYPNEEPSETNGQRTIGKQSPARGFANDRKKEKAKHDRRVRFNDGEEPLAIVSAEQRRLKEQGANQIYVTQ